MFARFKSRRAAVALFALIAVALSLGVWLVRDPFRAQDACAFGTIDNARYRELLGQARQIVDAERSDFVLHFTARNIRDGSDLLYRQQQQLFSDLEGIDERIAAMHALARAYGARFTHTLPDNPNPWGVSPALAPDTIRYVYSVSFGGLSIWLPIRQWIRLTGEFAIRDVGAGFERARGIRRNTLLMFATGSGTAPQLAPPSPTQFHACPPVPSRLWWEAFIAPPATDPALVAGSSDAVAPLVPLADGFVARDRPRHALPHLERALSISENVLGTDSRTTIRILDRLGRIYHDIGQPLKAAEYEGLALDARIRAQPPDPAEE